MKHHQRTILPDDRAYAIQRVTELEREIQDLGPEFNDVFTQSSETWHDNAPFDALRDKQSRLAAELQFMREIVREGIAELPKPYNGAIGTGSIVTLSTKKCYRIAGDWTPHAGQEIDGVINISRQAPLALALLGKRSGDVIALNGRNFTVLSVEEASKENKIPPTK